MRTKDVFDGATPSANAVAALALARLGALTGDDRYTAAAREVVALLGALLGRHPAAFAHTVARPPTCCAGGSTEVVVTGDRPDLVEVVQRRVAAGRRSGLGRAHRLPPCGKDGRDRAYVCRDYACQTPASDPATLTAQLAPTGR